VPDSRGYPLGDAELAFFRELYRSGARFLVVGVGSAVLQGADLGTQDLDLWFETVADGKIVAAAAAAGGRFVWRTDPPMIVGKGLDRLDVVLHCDGLRGFDAEYEKGIVLRIADFELKLLPIDRVMASKKAAGRRKDKAAVEALRAAMAAIRSRRR
jgi:hypothetical protein